jgi:hypothetical protein
MNFLISIRDFLWDAFIEGFAGSPIKAALSLAILGYASWWIYAYLVNADSTSNLRNVSSPWRYAFFAFIYIASAGSFNSLTGLFKNSYGAATGLSSVK